MIVFDIDIPKLTEEGIQMRCDPFANVGKLYCSSMVECLLMIKMLMLLINSFKRRDRIRIHRIRYSTCNIS